MLVSFDVFDTALIRKVYKPVDIFDLVDDTFKQKRIQAENLARIDNMFYTLSDIYKHIPERKYKTKTEINLEYDNCEQNTKIYKKYLQHIENGDTVIFISDMYLPSIIIRRMLEKCGYTQPKVYVSCEMGAYKSDGSLFRKVQEIEGKIDIHYGDNYQCDIVAAMNEGIKPIFNVALENIKTDVPDVNSKLRKYLIQNEQSVLPLDCKIARYLAPMVYDFTKWILDNREKGQKIFFNARDGYLPYLLAKDVFKADNIHYIECSRKSVLFCSFDFSKPIESPVNALHFERLILPRTGGVFGFLESINFPEERIKLLTTKPKENIREFVIRNQKELYKYFKECKDNALKYLDKFNLSNDDMIVDVGYFGSIQMAIEQITNKKLNGMYLQTFPSDVDKFCKRYSYFERPIVKYCLMIESVMSSAEDGVYGYTKFGEPIHYKDNDTKKAFSQRIIKNVMESCKFIHNEKIPTNSIDVEKLVVRLLYYPTLEESKYCNEPIFENGNIKEFESVVWFEPDLIKRGELQHCYDKSYWRPAFMVQLRNDKELAYLEKFIRIHD